MPTPNTTRANRSSIDARRRLKPRDYFQHPDLFGQDPQATTTVPNGGDNTSMEVAHITHLCVSAWRHNSHKTSGAALARRFGFSRQTWSHVTRGHRWPATTVLTAMLIGAKPKR